MEATTERSVVYAREARLTYQKRTDGERMLGTQVTDSTVAAAHVRHAIGEPIVEHFVCIALDNRGRSIGWSTIGIGTISACPVDVTQIARFSVLAGARAVILGHNHPSGDPSPSPDDLALTERIVQALTILGVQTMDHVIVAGEGNRFSFLDAGLLPKGGRR